MNYQKDSLVINYLRRFYNSTLFLAMLVATLVAIMYVLLLEATAAGTVEPFDPSTRLLQPAEAEIQADDGNTHTFQPSIDSRALETELELL
jgi:hypothetical protein